MAQASRFGGVKYTDLPPKIGSCAVCRRSFQKRSGVHKFCSDQCKGKWQYISGRLSTESQYKEISGNWRRYCSRLLYYGGRRRDHLTVDILLAQLEAQNYKCALSGVPLTCNLQKGIKFQTNASIDRIIAGGPYTADNIQIVCRALNHWRADTPIDNFVGWCRAVVEHHDQCEEGAENGYEES